MSGATSADKTVALEILRQLGGHQFVAMTGARNLMSTPDSLAFRIPSAKDGINYVKITLTPADDYIVQFSRIRGITVSSVDALVGIYCDQLQQVFTDATGLLTKLV